MGREPLIATVSREEEDMVRLLAFMICCLLAVSGCKKTEPRSAGIDVGAADVVQPNELATRKKTPTPRLWEDKAVASLIDVAFADDSESVYVIRWEHGDLHASVELAESVDTAPVKHEMSLTANDLAADCNLKNIEDISGVLLLHMRKLQDVSQEVFKVRAMVILDVVFADGDSLRSPRNLSKGTLVRIPSDYTPTEGSFLPLTRASSLIGHNYDFQMMKWQDGQEVAWLKLKLTELGSTPAQSGEQTDEREPE